MAEGTPVTYEDLTEELKKKYDEVKEILADLIGSFQRTRSHGIGWKGFSPGRARWSGPVRANHEALVLSVRPALGTHQGRCHSVRPPLPFALAAPEVPNSPAYVVYKIW
ncbi:hypothetical protein QYE76_057081 [Lolium multiflorum]|uniref:Uncharacterized protein n=1 Tax=Lolium multiflorum TaxID=4521 RepID=A0AAD8T2Q8_LOLMU|nr:hypothetical protein QYE76_057081 [Lolium multiflorum]